MGLAYLKAPDIGSAIVALNKALSLARKLGLMFLRGPCHETSTRERKQIFCRQEMGTRLHQTEGRKQSPSVSFHAQAAMGVAMRASAALAVGWGRYKNHNLSHYYMDLAGTCSAITTKAEV